MRIKTRHILMGFLIIISQIGFAQVDEENEVEEVVIESYDRDLRYTKDDIPEPDFSLRTKPTHKYKNDRLWFTYDWKVTKNKAFAHYYRTKPVQKDNLFLIQDFYLDGTKQMEGTFIDFDGNIEHGKIKYYRPNGTLDYVAYYGNDRFLEGFKGEEVLDVINKTSSYIEFKLPKTIKKNEVKEEDSDFSFSDLFDLDKQLRAELNLDESVYQTKEIGNKIVTIERSTGREISTLITNGKEITSGFLKLYTGNRLIGEIKANSNDNASYDLVLYHNNGSVFLTSNLEKGSSKFYAPNGDIIAENDGGSGSFLLGLDNKAILGFSYITPIAEDQSYIIGYVENGKMLYLDKYYRYNVPYRLYDKSSGYTREYKEDGTIISEYIDPDKGDIYGFGLEDKLKEGYRSTLYKSKRLKRKAYFKPTSKTVEYYRDDNTESIEYKDFYKKEEVDGSYFFPYKRIKYNQNGVKIFEEEIKDKDSYSSVNYNNEGKKIGEFKGEIFRASVGDYPTKGRYQEGFISNSYETDRYDMFESPDYDEINVKVHFELNYEQGVKKRELLEINDVIFVDYNSDGESVFYNPISGKDVTCIFKNGEPFSGEFVDYNVSSNSIKLESIKKYKEGQLIFSSEFREDYSDGTYYHNKTENIDGEEILYTFFNGTEYRFNKTTKDGIYVGRGWKMKEILDGNTYYSLGTDLSITEFKNGQLLSVENYKTIFIDATGKKTPNTEHYFLTNKFYYQQGKLGRLESYSKPDNIFKDLRNKLILEFKDEQPYSGEVFIENYFDDAYYRLKNGKVIQKLKKSVDDFLEITDDSIKVRRLRDRDVYSYMDYIQIIDFSKKDYSYTYTAIGPDGDEYKAEFDGIKMKSGVFYFEKTFDGVYTLIVKDDILYMVDKYIDPSLFRTSQAIKQIPISSSKEEFEEFYDLYDSTELMFIDVDDSLELNFTD